jgi:hypothetical protein
MNGNPASFLVDALGPCVPFLSLQGGQDQASQEARALGNFDQDSSSWSQTDTRSVYQGARNANGEREVT